MKKKFALVLTVVFLLSASAVAFASTTKGVFSPKSSTESKNTTPADAQEKNLPENSPAKDPHVITTTLTAEKLEILVNEELQIVATTENRGNIQIGAFDDEWTSSPATGATVIKNTTPPEKVGGKLISKAMFKASQEGTYTISYKIEIDSGANDGKFVAENVIVITVVKPAPQERKIVSLEIVKAHIDAQDNGNDKKALYIDELKVSYSDGSNSYTAAGFIYKIGNIYSKKDRRFGVTYEGFTQQFEALKVLESLELQSYDDYIKSLQGTEKPSHPDKPGKPDKPEKPAK